MRANSRAIQSYGDVKVGTGVANASNVQLIQMLFDGLLESMSATRGHIEHKNIQEKSKSIARASRIVLGLQGALDFEKGGDIARNLNDLYSYVTRDRKSTRLNSSHTDISRMPSSACKKTATTEIYTLSLHDALPICKARWILKKAATLPAT